MRAATAAVATIVVVGLIAYVVYRDRGRDAPESVSRTPEQMAEEVRQGLPMHPLAGEAQIVAKGAIRQGHGPKTFVWETPGKVQFHLTIPWNETVAPKDLLAEVIADPENDAFKCGSVQPEAVLKDSQLHVFAELTVMAAFDTRGKIALRLSRIDEGRLRQLGEWPLAVRFVN